MAEGHESLGRSVARGGSITIVVQLGKVVVQFVGLVVLSRLVEPEVFGLFAIVTACFAFGEMIRDFGLTSAAIQTRDLSARQASNLFWLSIAIASSIAIIFALVAPLLSQSLDFPTELVPVVCAAFLINGAQSQFQVRLTREYEFARLALSDLGAQAVGVTTAIVMAVLGFGLWALAMQFIAQYICLLVVRVVLAGWLPGLPGRSEGVLPLIRFGIDVGSAQVLGYFAGNADVFVIAARFGPGPLGYYSRAFQLLSAPMNQLMAPLTHVFLPALARAHREGVLAALFLRLQWIVMLGGCAFFAAVAINHQSLTLVVLGPSWGPSAVLLCILAVGGIFQIVSFTGFWVFLATGASRQLLIYNVVTKVATIGLVVAGSFFGVVGVAVGYASGLLLSSVACVWWIPRLIGVRPAIMLRQIASVYGLLIPAALVSTGVVVLLQTQHSFLSLVLGISAFLGTLGATCAGIPSARHNLSTAVGTLGRRSDGAHGSAVVQEEESL